MDTISTIDQILQIVGNLGGFLVGLYKEAIGVISEYEMPIVAVVLLMFLILILWPKGRCPVSQTISIRFCDFVFK